MVGQPSRAIQQLLAEGCTLVTVQQTVTEITALLITQQGQKEIDARDSVVKFNGNGMFVANSAGSKGAAIHISFLIFQGSSSF